MCHNAQLYAGAIESMIGLMAMLSTGEQAPLQVQLIPRRNLGRNAERLQVMHALAALNLPDLLHDGPKPAAELAPMAGVPVSLDHTRPTCAGCSFTRDEWATTEFSTFAWRPCQ